MERVIRRLLQVEPDARHASASELREELEGLLERAGIEDVEQHLQQYFASPRSYSEELTPVLVSSSLEQAREAERGGNFAAALSLCDRVLAFEPEQPEALALIEQLTARGGQRRLVLLLGLLVLVVATGGGLYAWLGSPAPAPVTARDGGPPDGAPAADAAAPPADQPRRPDLAAPDVGPDTRRVSTRSRPWKARPLPPRVPDASRPRPPRPPDSAAPRPDLQPISRHAWLKVRLGPWCEVWLDGKRVGISPMKKFLKIAPGKHQVRCRFHGGAQVVREVKVQAGQREVIKGTDPVRITLKLARGRVVRLEGGAVLRSGQRLKPKRYRMDLMEGGKVISGKWVTIPSHDCTLVDSPKLKCR